MRRRSLSALQNRLCGPPWCSPSSSKQYYFSHIAPKTAPYEANGGTNSDFIPMLCKNNGIISFSLGKLTLLGGHKLTFAPKFWLFESQNCILNQCRGYLSLSVANRGARQTAAGLAFPASSGQNWRLAQATAFRAKSFWT